MTKTTYALICICGFLAPIVLYLLISLERAVIITWETLSFFALIGFVCAFCAFPLAVAFEFNLKPKNKLTNKEQPSS